MPGWGSGKWGEALWGADVWGASTMGVLAAVLKDMEQFNPEGVLEKILEELEKT